MTDRLDRLYELLPVVHRMRDAEAGEPLRALLRVIARQVNVVEDDIAQLYENWFIETGEDWVVPYIGQLVGYTPAVDPGLAADLSTATGRERARAVFPRADVSNTIRNRRRKGTLALLELLARDVAGWPARAVEFFKLVGWFQNVNYTHMDRSHTVDVRLGSALELIGTPFDVFAHVVDVRRINSHRRARYYNIPSVGVFVWRLRAYRVSETPAAVVEEQGPNCFTFSVLGNNAPLFTRPQPETDPTSIAGELNVPGPIRRRALQDNVAAYVDNSFRIWAPNWLRPGRPMRIVSTDLTDWSTYRPRRNVIAVDPVLGRMLFPPEQPPKDGVTVSYHYGFAGDIGGGEYPRTVSEPEDAQVFGIGPDEEYASIQQALAAWQGKHPRDAVLEIRRSGVYVEPVSIDLPEGSSLQLRAKSGVRAVLRLIDWQTSKPDSLLINGGSNSRCTLDGLLITGRPVRITGRLAQLTIRHSTLVPGWGLQHDCEPRRPSEPSLEVFSATAAVCIEHSIVGSIQVSIPVPDEAPLPQNAEDADLARCLGYHVDPLRMDISDSIVDATGRDREAIGAPGCSVAHVCLRILRTTVFGETQAHAIELGQDSIFDGRIVVARRQIGCLRFCYVRPGSRAPRKFRCQPQPENTVEPLFTSARYGRPAYGQLSQDCPSEIAEGASDQSEMGAFHDLYQPQRAALLRVRLDESMPAGYDTGLIFVT